MPKVDEYFIKKRVWNDTSLRLGKHPWIVALRRIFVSFGHHPKTPPIRRLTLLPGPCRWALCSRAYGLGLGPLSRKLQWPASCLTVRTMASLSLFFGTSQQHLNLPLPTISLCTTNRVGVSHVFLCSVTTFVLFVFVFTCALCPSVYFPMSLSCILCSYICTALSSKEKFLYTAPFDTLYILP